MIMRECVSYFRLLRDVVRRQRRAFAEEESSICFLISSWPSFCQGISRYSLRIIFWRSSQSFHACAETFS